MKALLLALLLSAACFSPSQARTEGEPLNWYVELPKAGITLGTTLIGSFVGAILAFWLQNLRDERAERKRQLAAVNHAIYILGQL